MNEPVLAVADLRVRIGDRTVVADLRLTLPAGGRLALVGASGSGKSLTAAAVAGLTPPTAQVSGSVTVSGVDVTSMPAPRRPAQARVAVVAQDTSTALNPLVRVGAQLAPRGRRTDVHPLLSELGLDPAAVLRRYPGELSGGQRQRVCLALALCSGTPLVVADEPTTALDVVTQADVVRVLRDRTGPNGPALLFVTHDLAVAAALCEQVAVLDAGRVVEAGPTGTVLRAPRSTPARALVDAARDACADLPARS